MERNSLTLKKPLNNSIIRYLLTTNVLQLLHHAPPASLTLNTKFQLQQRHSQAEFPTIPISQLGGRAGISNLPQYEVEFGLCSLPSLSWMTASPWNQKALLSRLGYMRSHVWSWRGIWMQLLLHRGASEVRPAHRETSRKIERGLFSCILQLLAFPRCSAVCKPSVKE